MSSIFAGCLTILWLNGSILIIPGTNFLLIVRHATCHGRSVALICALGITVAIMLHVLVAYFFVGFILEKFPILFDIIKYTGVGFLIYLALRMLKSPISTQSCSLLHTNKKNISSAFIEGFFVDLLNPFVIFFYVSLFTAIIKPSSSIIDSIPYILTIFGLTLSWFMLVGLVFSYAKIRNYLYKKQLLLNRFASGAFIWFAYKLAFAHIA